MNCKHCHLVVKAVCAPCHARKGIGLIIVIMILAFLLSVGMVLITTTSTGTQVAANIRWQQEAFNAAEAGFDAAWLLIDEHFAENMWTSFEGHLLQEPAGIDDPLEPNYFRRLSNEQVLDAIGDFQAGIPNFEQIVFYRHDYRPGLSYTVFLIDDEGLGEIPDPSDALLVCIGVAQSGDQLTTSRIEVALAADIPGNP